MAFILTQHRVTGCLWNFQSGRILIPTVKSLPEPPSGEWRCRACYGRFLDNFHQFSAQTPPIVPDMSKMIGHVGKDWPADSKNSNVPGIRRPRFPSWQPQSPSCTFNPASPLRHLGNECTEYRVTPMIIRQFEHSQISRQAPNQQFKAQELQAAGGISSHIASFSDSWILCSKQRRKDNKAWRLFPRLSDSKAHDTWSMTHPFDRDGT